MENMKKMLDMYQELVRLGYINPLDGVQDSLVMPHAYPEVPTSTAQGTVLLEPVGDGAYPSVFEDA